MTVAAKNELVRKALGIRTMAFVHYRAGKSHWRVTLEDGDSFVVITHNLGTESTVLRVAAQKLAQRSRPVQWPKGA